MTRACTSVLFTAVCLALLLTPKAMAKRSELGMLAEDVVQDQRSLGDALLSRYLKKYPASTWEWNWGPSVLLFALGRYAEGHPEGATYHHVLRQYHQRFLARGLPKIDSSDRCAPGLSALTVYQEGAPWALASINAVLKYIKEAPRNQIGTLDHLGSSIPGSLVYPSSIWIDSLMMWGLFAFQAANLFDDADLREFALAQAGLYFSKLKDAESGLLLHAWNVRANSPLPRGNVPWLRGNGWAMVFLVEVLEALEIGHPRYQEHLGMFLDLANNTLKYRHLEGWWDTVIQDPGRAYPEVSGTALIAYAYAKGARLGLLPPSFAGEARRSLSFVMDNIRSTKDGAILGGVSIGTNPSTARGYALTPRATDRSFGLGAVLLLLGESMKTRTNDNP